MAISSIISFGFGNGTFAPGVSKLPTLGYSIGVGDDGLGPFCVQAMTVHCGGSVVIGVASGGLTGISINTGGALVAQVGCL